MQLIFCPTHFFAWRFRSRQTASLAIYELDNLEITIVVTQTGLRYNLVLAITQTFRFNLIACFEYYIFGDYNFVERYFCSMR